MFLRNIVAFGNKVPGDLVLVPDGCVFDTTYFQAVIEDNDDEELQTEPHTGQEDDETDLPDELEKE